MSISQTRRWVQTRKDKSLGSGPWESRKREAPGKWDLGSRLPEALVTLCLVSLWKPDPLNGWQFTLRKRSLNFFFLFKLYPWHMEVLRLGFESELQLQAYAIATATLDLSCICNLCNLSITHWVRPGIKLASLWTLCLVLKPLSYNGNSRILFYLFIYFFAF